MVEVVGCQSAWVDFVQLTGHTQGWSQGWCWVLAGAWCPRCTWGLLELMGRPASQGAK